MQTRVARLHAERDLRVGGFHLRRRHQAVAQIEAGGRPIAVCRPGDFLGEMSFLTGSMASANVEAVTLIRVLAFDQTRLHAAMEADASIRRAMEAGLNRNLVGKLVRANAGTGPGGPALAQS